MNTEALVKAVHDVEFLREDLSAFYRDAIEGRNEFAVLVAADLMRRAADLHAGIKAANDAAAAATAKS